jgi:hypothetical protein
MSQLPGIVVNIFKTYDKDDGNGWTANSTPCGVSEKTLEFMMEGHRWEKKESITPRSGSGQPKSIIDNPMFHPENESSNRSYRVCSKRPTSIPGIPPSARYILLFNLTPNGLPQYCRRLDISSSIRSRADNYNRVAL